MSISEYNISLHQSYMELPYVHISSNKQLFEYKQPQIIQKNSNPENCSHLVFYVLGRKYQYISYGNIFFFMGSSRLKIYLLT